MIKKIISQLLKKKLKLSVAESCTGGLLASSITSISGASKIFNLGLITYSNQSKIKILKVNKNIIKKYGAVSHECCLSMVNNLSRISKAHINLSVTGIAGPNGGTKEKPVGLVYISIVGPNNQITNIKKMFSSTQNRVEIQRLSVNVCLNSLRLILLSNSK